MATDFNKIRQDIRSDIRPNGEGEITGQIMQDTLIEIVDAIEEGADENAQAIERIDNDIMRIDDKLVANREEVGTQFAEVNTRIDENAQAIETLTSEIKEFPEGYYPNMSVGFADNLVGRGDVKEADFTFRASAAQDNITDDTARVKRIKGNSVVWNQLIPILDSDATISNNGVTIKDNRNGTYTISTDAGGATANTSVSIGPKVLIKAGHKYIIQGGYSNNLAVWGASGYVATADTKGGTIIQGLDGVTYYNPTIFVRSGFVATTPITIRPKITDLTQMFTSGNEPTTVEEFYARIPSGIDVNAYNEGEIISMHTKAIRTIGFNQWDEQWVNGRADANVQNGLRCADYIRVIPNTTYYLNNGGYGAVNGVVRYFDKDKNFLGDQSLDSTRLFATPQNCMYIIFFIPTDNPVTQYNNDVCLNLSHSGWRNGQYAPYTPFTRELAIIKKYFQNGMRSAGNAFDSIEWDSSKQKWVAVHNVGVRAYEEGDDTNTAVITDGTNTHYALAEPIVTEIEEENINFDYYVEDFGTEEALSDVPSASFRADVIYTPNAVDDIRALLVRVKNLEDSVHNIQLTQNTISN